jgi:hypothetical protein
MVDRLLVAQARRLSANRDCEDTPSIVFVIAETKAKVSRMWMRQRASVAMRERAS